MIQISHMVYNYNLVASYIYNFKIIMWLWYYCMLLACIGTKFAEDITSYLPMWIYPDIPYVYGLTLATNWQLLYLTIQHIASCMKMKPTLCFSHWHQFGQSSISSPLIRDTLAQAIHVVTLPNYIITSF